MLNKDNCKIYARMLHAKLLSRVWLYVTPWTVGRQAPLSMGFSRQEYWNGLPCLSPGDFPHPGIEPRSPTLQADSLPSDPPGKTHVTLCAIKCFASMIKLKILSLGHHPGIFRWIQCNHKGSSKGKRETGESGKEMWRWLCFCLWRWRRSQGMRGWKEQGSQSL